ncbi:hypothetical protein B0H17DRAFT_1210132 [Mycena rosella]|uniref:Uncharacterized protein n=1 Tax=Mycena rosella TaxID=1033263 RepID=A0AAD7CXD2_MYCRO|nr:hypothetical protein B0H17DRAFT_1210132 [Mycena rosella]
MSHSALGCAQNEDGSLRDASQILWYNDVDDEHSISGPPPASTASSSRPLAPIFTRAKPVGKVAGSRRSSPRRSSRASRPSARAIDPNNAEASTAFGKRKLGPENPPVAPCKTPRISEPAATDSGDDESDAESTTPSMVGDTDIEEVGEQDGMDIDTEEYRSIKAMADTDHAHINTKISREDSTADIKTIFHRVKAQRNAETGVLQDGAICMVCTQSQWDPGFCLLFDGQCQYAA